MALTERLQKTTDVGYWTGQIPLEYIYTFGRAGEAYFRSIAEKGTFLGAKCNKCDITYVPPRTYCEKCFDRLEDNYIDVGTKGSVLTYTVLYKNLDGSQKEVPTIMAMVILEGTEGGVLHYLGGIEPEDVAIGMAVEAVFIPESERKGGINDIKYFKPIA